jgi:hypothetical protein
MIIRVSIKYEIKAGQGSGINPSYRGSIYHLTALLTYFLQIGQGLRQGGQ